MRLSFLSKRRKEILEEENCIFYQTRNSFAAVGSSSASTPERAGTKSSDNVEEEKFSFDPFPMDGANERRHETDEGGFPFHLLLAKDGIFSRTLLELNRVFIRTMEEALYILPWVSSTHLLLRQVHLFWRFCWSRKKTPFEGKLLLLLPSSNRSPLGYSSWRLVLA